MSDPRSVARRAGTLLFVPGDRPERFAKAAAAGADLVVVDLEDAVAPGRKDRAREDAAAWLEGDPSAVRAVRVNAADTGLLDADLAALSGRDCVVMLPKAEDPAVVGDVLARLSPGSCVVALVETAAGVLAAATLAAVTGVGRLAFGSFDLAAQLGVSPDDRLAMAPSRGALVLASAAAGLAAPIDGVTGDIMDDAVLRDDLAHAVRLGFGAKLCIHPRQVPVARAVLRPSPEDVTWARKVVAAAREGGVVLVAGRMVDKPVVDRARRILASAGEPEG